MNWFQQVSNSIHMQNHFEKYINIFDIRHWSDRIVTNSWIWLIYVEDLRSNEVHATLGRRNVDLQSVSEHSINNLWSNVIRIHEIRHKPEVINTTID